MRDSAAVLSRSIATLLVMSVTFTALVVLFMAVDAHAGVHPSTPLLFVGVAAIPTATVVAGSVTPQATTTSPAVVYATESATAIPQRIGRLPDMTETPRPTPLGGKSPPYYGTLPNYANNTAFSESFLQALDERIIVLTNSQRLAHGLSALTEIPQLDTIAAARSQDLIKRHYCGHYDPTGFDVHGHQRPAIQELLQRDDVSYSEIGENLVCNMGYALDDNTPAQTVDAWMGHPEHRANILHTGYTGIGIGIAVEAETAGLRVVMTQVFLR